MNPDEVDRGFGDDEGPAPSAIRSRVAELPALADRRRSQGNGRRGKATDGAGRRRTMPYVTQAVLSPAHLALLLLPAILRMAGCGVAVLLSVVLLEEVFLIALLPRMGVFQRYVEKKAADAERETAQEERLALLARMSSEHRAELERLETLADKICARITPAGAGIDVVMITDCLGLGRLLSSYVGLAIAYKASQECLAQTNRQALDDEIGALGNARFGASEQVRALALRRLAIAEMRAERWDRSWSDADAMRNQLAMIGEIIQLTHEQCLAPQDPRRAGAEIDRAIAGLPDNEQTLREIRELLSEAETVEATTLYMGRVPPASELGLDAESGRMIQPLRVVPPAGLPTVFAPESPDSAAFVQNQAAVRSA